MDDALEQTYLLRVRGDPALRTICTPVEDFDALEPLITGMYDVLYRRNGWGLAAPQVGDTRRVFLTNVKRVPLVFVNPRISDGSGLTLSTEGCLSIPHRKVPVVRRRAVTIGYQDMHGDPHIQRLTGDLAVVAQHELDHLDGILITDYLNPLMYLRGKHRP